MRYDLDFLRGLLKHATEDRRAALANLQPIQDRYDKITATIKAVEMIDNPATVDSGRFYKGSILDHLTSTLLTQSELTTEELAKNVICSGVGEYGTSNRQTYYQVEATLNHAVDRFREVRKDVWALVPIASKEAKP